MNYLLLNLLGYRLVISFESVDTYYDVLGTNRRYELKNVNVIYIKIDDGVGGFAYNDDNFLMIIPIIPDSPKVLDSKYRITIKEGDHLDILNIRINKVEADNGAINILENINYEDMKLYLEVIE